MTTISISANNDQIEQHQTDSVISYSLDFARFNEHLIDVKITFAATSDTPKLWLPSWIPGSYLLREFARHITSVHYRIKTNDDTQPQMTENKAVEHNDIFDNSANKIRHRARKADKQTWYLPEVKAGQAIEVTYEVYCYDLSVRTAYVDQYRLYGNFTSLSLAIEGREQSPVSVNLLVPSVFFTNNEKSNDVVSNVVSDSASSNKYKVVLACGLAASHLQLDGQHRDGYHGYGLHADNYHELIDYPFEISAQQSFDFIIQDTQHQTLPHRFYLSGRHTANTGRLQRDLTQICQTYLNWLGDAPFNDYTFMTYASGQDYGGLEHINSTSLITPRRDLPTSDEDELPSKGYQRFLGLCSHEYFHAWWVKTVRPDVMLDVDLRREAYTPMLWVFEGFTSYVDDFMLQVSGVIDKSAYLKLLAEQINRYYQTKGRGHQSVAESSFDAWIKLYRSDENTGNAGISYYNKGALVALCLDLTLLQKSKGQYRLFDVIKAFYKQAKDNDNQRIGMSRADLGAVIGSFMPKADWDDFERRYVNGVDELPIKTLLTDNGIKWHEDLLKPADKTTPWGMRCVETPVGLKVNNVQRASIAATAGISAHDVIVAIDGIKADVKQLAIYSPLAQPVSCHLFRRDELIQITISPMIEEFEVADDEQTNVDSVGAHKVNLRMEEEGFKKWLNPDCLETIF